VERLFIPDEGVATVGRLSVTPNATNVIPGHVTLWTDMRSVDSARLVAVRDSFPDLVREIGHRRGLNIEADLLSHEDPVQIPSDMQDLLASSIDALGVQYLRLPSFAGHDSNQLAKLCPIGMLFVPSRAGRSHCPEEWTEPDDIVLGARALLAAVLNFDRRVPAR
jgi:N-carbamoyl-L-amino-acid hydrolase